MDSGCCQAVSRDRLPAEWYRCPFWRSDDLAFYSLAPYIRQELGMAEQPYNWSVGRFFARKA